MESQPDGVGVIYLNIYTRWQRGGGVKKRFSFTKRHCPTGRYEEPRVLQPKYDPTDSQSLKLGTGMVIEVWNMRAKFAGDLPITREEEPNPHDEPGAESGVAFSGHRISFFFFSSNARTLLKDRAKSRDRSVSRIVFLSIFFSNEVHRENWAF